MTTGEKKIASRKRLCRIPRAQRAYVRTPVGSKPTKTTECVKVAATSDLHGHLEGLEQVVKDKGVDVLVIAGDIQPAEMAYHSNLALTGDWFRSGFFRLVKSLDCEVVAIPGNHDFFLRHLIGEMEKDRQRTSARFCVPGNFHLLCDSGIRICGLDFYGTPWVPTINGCWCYEVGERKLAQKFDMIPKGMDVLITHTPPKFAMLDVSLEYDPEGISHFGSDALLGAIQEKQPRYCICGHIHSGDHQKNEIRLEGPGLPLTTEIYNVSRVGERYSIVYNIKILPIRMRKE